MQVLQVNHYAAESGEWGTMRTANERLEELESRVDQLEQRQMVALSVAYEAFDAALQNLRDNRLIQGVHYKCAIEAVQQRMNESLAKYPDLLDHMRFGHWPRRFREGH